MESRRDNVEKYLCAHCRVGIVRTLPSECPECQRLLNKKINNKEENNETKNSC